MNEFGYTLQSLPRLIGAVSRAPVEPAQFGPTAGVVTPEMLEEHRTCVKCFQRLARKALRLQSQAYLDVVAERLWVYQTGVFYIPAG